MSDLTICDGFGIEVVVWFLQNKYEFYERTLYYGLHHNAPGKP